MAIWIFSVLAVHLGEEISFLTKEGIKGLTGGRLGEWQRFLDTICTQVWQEKMRFRLMFLLPPRSLPVTPFHQVWASFSRSSGKLLRASPSGIPSTFIKMETLFINASTLARCIGHYTGPGCVWVPQPIGQNVGGFGTAHL